MSPNQTNTAETLTPEIETSSSLGQVIHLNRTQQVRQEIRIIADRCFREHFISEEAYREYQTLAEGREEKKLTNEMLESARKFAKEHEDKAVQVHQRIVAARAARIASGEDEQYLIGRLVAGNIGFVQDFPEIESKIDEKIANMKRDKGIYEKLSQHKLIRNTWFLKVGPGKKINFISEEDFLKKTVPERRAFLKEIQEALPEAEKYAKEQQKVVDLRQIKAYKGRLTEARDGKKIIGKRTFDKYMDGFKHVDSEEREVWLEEFDAQMERYAVLWGQIRTGLRGQTLADMEKKRDKMGYTDLLAEFGRVKEAESGRLIESYEVALESYQENGIIGEHTVSEFKLWIRSEERSMADRYDAEVKLPGQMQRYQDLWKEIEVLKPKQQEEMKAYRDEEGVGYSELRAKLTTLQQGEPANDNADEAELENTMANVRSSETKKAIRKTEELLEKGGRGKKETFFGLVRRIIYHQSGRSFDATNFEKQVQVKNKKLTKKEAKLHENEGFIEAEAANKKGQTHRNTQVEINRETSLDEMLSKKDRYEYRSEERKTGDDLSLATRTDDGRTVEMDLGEVYALKGYVEAKDAQRKKAKEEEKQPKKAA